MDSTLMHHPALWCYAVVSWTSRAKTSRQSFLLSAFPALTFGFAFVKSSPIWRQQSATLLCLIKLWRNHRASGEAMLSTFYKLLPSLAPGTQSAVDYASAK